MAAYDRLPKQLRHMMRELQLDWCPISVREALRKMTGQTDDLNEIARAMNRLCIQVRNRDTQVINARYEEMGINLCHR